MASSDKQQQTDIMLITFLIPLVSGILYFDRFQELVSDNFQNVLWSWWIAYGIACIIAMGYIFDMYNTYIRMYISQSACHNAETILERETLRFNLSTFISNSSTYAAYVTLALAWVAMLLATISMIVAYVVSPQSNRMFHIVVCSSLTLAVLIFNAASLRIYDKRVWYRNADTQTYNVNKRIILDFIRQLQYKTIKVQTIPFELETLRYNIISRMMMDQELPNVDEASAAFTTKPAEELFGYLALTSTDYNLLTTTLTCDNFYQIAYMERLKKLLFSEKYKRMLRPGIKPETLEGIFVTNVLADSEMVNKIKKSVPSNVQITEESLNGIIIDRFPYEDVRLLFQYLPLTDIDKADIENLIQNVGTDLRATALKFTACNRGKKVYPTMKDHPMLRFYSTADTVPNEREWNSMYNKLHALSTAIEQLRYVDAYSPEKPFKTGMYNIMYYTIVLFSVFVFMLFHMFYVQVNDGSLIALCVLALVATLIYALGYINML